MIMVINRLISLDTTNCSEGIWRCIILRAWFQNVVALSDMHEFRREWVTCLHSNFWYIVKWLWWSIAWSRSIRPIAAKVYNVPLFYAKRYILFTRLSGSTYSMSCLQLSRITKRYIAWIKFLHCSICCSVFNMHVCAWATKDNRWNTQSR